jgi:hypothetical protein
VKPWSHAVNSVKRYGGRPEDYLPIHDWFDSTKAAWADVRHRAILHNTFGIFLAEQLFGHHIINSDGKLVQVRDVAEDHVAEDFGGKIPTIEQFLKGLTLEPWMAGRGQKQFQDRDIRLSKKED